MRTDDADVQRPWADWPTIIEVARDHGWQLLAERGGGARLERRDVRSSTGAVELAIGFDAGGAISAAEVAELGYCLDPNSPQKLDTILGWLSE